YGLLFSFRRSRSNNFIGAAVAGPSAVEDCQFVELFARRSWILASQTGTAQPRGVQADTASHRFQRKIIEAVGAQLRRHGEEIFLSRPGPSQETWGKQLLYGRHVDTVKAWGDNGRARNPHMDLARPASFSQLTE